MWKITKSDFVVVSAWNKIRNTNLCTTMSCFVGIAGGTKDCAVREGCALGASLWVRGVDIGRSAAEDAAGLELALLAQDNWQGFREECVEPSMDIIAKVRGRRLKFLGHVLRREDSSLLKQVLLADGAEQLQEGKYCT